MNIKYKEEIREELTDCLSETKDYLEQNSKDLLLLLDNIPKPGTQEFIDAGLLPNKAKPMPYENEEMLRVVKNNLDELRMNVDELCVYWGQIAEGYEQ